MNRTKLIKAILEKAQVNCLVDYLKESLKYLSDTNLLAFALSLGIDIEKLFQSEVK